jgi:DNA-binding MarR family transcriptional regulator
VSPETFDVGAIVCDLNRTVHEPARLAILTVLSACDSADFVFLKAATGLTAGNLSVQITRLEEAGLVTVEKIIERRRTITTVSLTGGGRSELEVYWNAMLRIGQAVRRGDSPASESPATLPGRVRPQTS